jgi:hypothetical protein
MDNTERDTGHNSKWAKSAKCQPYKGYQRSAELSLTSAGEHKLVRGVQCRLLLIQRVPSIVYKLASCVRAGLTEIGVQTWTKKCRNHIVCLGVWACVYGGGGGGDVS